MESLSETLKALSWYISDPHMAPALIPQLAWLLQQKQEAYAFCCPGKSTLQHCAVSCFLAMMLYSLSVQGADVVIGRDTTCGVGVQIYGSTVIGEGVRIEGPTCITDSSIENGVFIRSFSVLEGAHISEGSGAGPFARLREGTVVAQNSYLGNFVETKNAKIGSNTLACHLTYLGDTEVSIVVAATTDSLRFELYLKKVGTATPSPQESVLSSHTESAIANIVKLHTFNAEFEYLQSHFLTWWLRLPLLEQSARLESLLSVYHCRQDHCHMLNVVTEQIQFAG